MVSLGTLSIFTLFSVLYFQLEWNSVNFYILNLSLFGKALKMIYYSLLKKKLEKQKKNLWKIQLYIVHGIIVIIFLFCCRYCIRDLGKKLFIIYGWRFFHIAFNFKKPFV